MSEEPSPGTRSGSGDARELRCPRCGLVSEGLRCERCNAPKITQCSGSCTMCGLAKCVAPKVREQGGL